MNYKTKKIRIVILSGSLDFGRCPVATRLPSALWPVAGKPAIGLLLENLSDQGISEAIICSNGYSSLLKESIKDFNRMKVSFLNETLPVGTAGAIREASRDSEYDLIIVLPANMIGPPDITKLIENHCKTKATMSIVFNSSIGDDANLSRETDIFICNPSVLNYIPDDGYFDIKEELIPSLVQKNKDVRSLVLPKNVCVFHNRRKYLETVGTILSNTSMMKKKFKFHKHKGTNNIWENGNVAIDPRARIHGSVAAMDGTCISKDAVILGPVLIGKNVVIGEGALVANSVLWDGAQIGNNCRINDCIIDYNAQVENNTNFESKALTFGPEGIVSHTIKKYKQRASQIVGQKIKFIVDKIPIGISFSLAIGLIFMAFLWTYWQGLVDLCRIWQRSDEYSSGLLVPFLAVYILWSRRDEIVKVPIKPFLWGIFAIGFAQAVRLLGLYFMYSSAERLSIVLTIAALVLMLFGWEIFKKVSTILIYLLFMLPWPNRIQAAIALPMQQWSTSSAVFCLEMLGCGIVREGNIIHIGQSTVAVAEACNGLRMVMAFFVITGLVVLLVKRSWWEKLIVLVSSLPIALLCNTVRLTVTALAFTVISGEKWEEIFHNFGGYPVMPLALALVVGELWLITKLTTVQKDTIEQIIITRKAKA